MTPHCAGTTALEKTEKGVKNINQYIWKPIVSRRKLRY
jgi:hypothetical protein